MASINPPWRFDPLQMVVNVSFGSAVCVVTSDANQAIWAIDPTKWQEFHFPIGSDLGGTGDNVQSISFDAVSKTFFIGSVFEDTESNTFMNVYSSSNGTAWKIPGDAANWPCNNAQLVDYIEGGVIDAIQAFPDTSSNGAWSQNGGKTWNKSDPIHPPVLDNHTFPLFLWHGNVVSGNELLDFTTGNPVGTIGAGVYDDITFAAGNGLLVGAGAPDDSDTSVIVSSSDNSSFTTIHYSALGLTSEVIDYNIFTFSVEEGFVAVPQTLILSSVIFITFVPMWELFVIAANNAVAVYANNWISGTPENPGFFYPVPHQTFQPAKIFTSPDGVNWTLRYTSGYVNGATLPVPVSGQMIDPADNGFVNHSQDALINGIAAAAPLPNSSP